MPSPGVCFITRLPYDRVSVVEVDGRERHLGEHEEVRGGEREHQEVASRLEKARPGNKNTESPAN